MIHYLSVVPLILVAFVRPTHQFSRISNFEKCGHQSIGESSALRLYKLDAELPPRSFMPSLAEDWDFHLLERGDIAEAAELAVQCFYSPRLSLNLDGMSDVEKWLWGGIINFYGNLDRSDTRNGNYLGFRSRSGKRLSEPSLALSTDSFILVATPAAKVGDSRKPEIAAIVEICAELPGGKLAPPIANPFRSRIVQELDKPYLCNLCVKKSYRRRGLGRLICELAEELVQIHWSKNVMYLHVEQSNSAAQAMYLGMGYQLVTPGLSAWEKKMEGMENILYYSNTLNRQWISGPQATNSLRKPKIQRLSQDATLDVDTASLLGMNELDMVIASNIMRSKA